MCVQWHSSTPNSTSHLSRKGTFADGRSSFLCLLFLAAGLHLETRLESNQTMPNSMLGPPIVL